MTKAQKVTNSNLPILDDTDRKWSSGDAIQRIKAWASEEGNVNYDKYRKAFFWVASKEDEQQADFKLPYADVVDGELKAVWSGVSAAMKALLGTGSADIPEDEKKEVYDAISKYYEKFNKEIPEFTKSINEERVEDDDNPDPNEAEETDEEAAEVDKYFVKAGYDPKEKLAVASTDIEDRHGERVSQDGWNLKDFKRNPVLLWAHDHTEIAVGNARNIHIERTSGSPRLVFTPDFHEATDKARALKILYEQGRLNSFSVGFRPLDFDGATNTYTKQELLEISAVNVPANPEARMLAYKSLVGKGFKKQFAKDMTGLDKLPSKKFVEQFKKIRGALQDEIDEEKVREQKHKRMRDVHEVFWAFCDVYYDEETPADDFATLLSEMVSILKQIMDGKYEPGNDETPETPEIIQPIKEGVLDKESEKTEDEDKQVKAQENKPTSAAPETRSVNKTRTQQSLVKTIAKASDKLLEGEKQGIGKDERVSYTKVIKRAAEILSVSHKREINGKNRRAV